MIQASTHGGLSDLTPSIEAAEEAIGSLRPTVPTTSLEDAALEIASAAPKLSSFLGHSAVSQCAKRFRERDRDAAEAQRRFHQLSARATWTIFAASIAAAALAAATPFLPPDSSPLSQLFTVSLGVISIGAAGISAMTLFQIERGQHLQQWITTRADAEVERIHYFDRLTEATTRKPVDLEVALQALEFFRRFQLGLQCHYYRESSRHHRLSSERTVWIGAIGALIVALGSGVAGLAASVSPKFGALAGIGLIGTALGAVGSRREEIRQDQRSAARYDCTARDLSRIMEEHTAIQIALAHGDVAPFVAYVHASHERISVEHRQWVKEVEEVAPGVIALQQSLKSSLGAGLWEDSRQRSNQEPERD